MNLADTSLATKDPSQSTIDHVIAELRHLYHDRVSTSLSVREDFATDFSFHKIYPSDAVIGVKSTEEVSQIVKLMNINIIIAGHTYQTRDYMPRVSAKLDIPFIPDIIGIDQDLYIKQVLNAKLNSSISCSTSSRILSFQSACFSEDDIITGTAEIKNIEVNLDSSLVRSTSEEPFQDSTSEVDLESSELIVSVGRGIEKEENISIAFDLAKVLNAEVSASRPVVDAGWMPSSRQVGSSGSTVAPKLYFSLGVSGAIQHVVGMKGSKTILAINKDRDAPIFEIADYAVIGDVLEIIPKLTEVLSE